MATLIDRPTGPFSSSGLGTNGSPRPFGAADDPQLSPEDRFKLDQQRSASIGPLLRSAATMFPSSRQRTQGEIINLTLALERFGNPFSVRRIPFSVLRDMLTDPMIGFAYYYTRIPLMRADWHLNCPDAQIAAAVDEALRPVNPHIQNQICGKLGYGFQPMCKTFKLGPLRSTYRDPTAADPEKDLPVWTSNVPALLWGNPKVLSPEHCLPLWNDQGEFDGFTYSLVPIPNPVQAGVTEIYGYRDIPGYRIPAEFAVWPVNEKDESMGSIFGSPRTRRAYRFYWSYWYRWALADRIFETAADPVKIVYYPTDVTEAIDPNDPNTTAPTALSLQAKALEIGASARQGATLAFPGDFMRDDTSGRMSTVRKWAIQYLENKADFAALDRTFTQLDALKFRCVTADTPIDCPRDHRRFPDGVPISMMKPGDLVWTFNTESRRFELRPIKGAMKTLEDQATFEVSLSNGQKIRATSTHPFLTTQLIWKTVAELEPGEQLTSSVGGDSEIREIKWNKPVSVIAVEPYSTEDVWDISIDGPEECTNFVAAGVVLHNSMFLPEEAFVQPGQGQRSARNVATQLGELYQQSAELLAEENDREINEHFIPQFIQANFPDRADTPCTKETIGFGAQDAETIKQIIQLVGQVRGEVLPVDIRELLRQMGLPLMSEAQQKKAEEQIAKEAATSAPPQVAPKRLGMQGYNSGIEKTPQGKSVYVQPPEVIWSSELSAAPKERFLFGLPEVPAYKDPATRASMIKLRKLFLDRYKSQIDSFVEHLRQRTTLRLAQQTTTSDAQTTQTTPAPQGLSAPGAAGVAGTLVSSWLALQAVDETTSVVKDLLYGIALNAGKRELKAINLKAELDPVALQTWASRRSQFVVGSVDDTLKGEFTTFLTEQLQRDTDPDSVAKAAEERFGETPRSHAERVVLAEALPAYNFGQLTALHDAGVSQVQAHDASGGRDELTDSECLQRDGQVMSVPDALAEAADEHPHGTLYFTALSTDDLQVLVVTSLPESAPRDETLLASYDSDHERLYILEDASEEQRREFSLAVGGSLALM